MRKLSEYNQSTQVETLRKKYARDVMLFQGSLYSLFLLGAPIGCFIILPLLGYAVSPFVFWFIEIASLACLLAVYIDAKRVIKRISVYEIQVVEKVHEDDRLKEDAYSCVKDIDGIWVDVKSNSVFNNMMVGQTYRVIVRNRIVESFYED